MGVLWRQKMATAAVEARQAAPRRSARITGAVISKVRVIAPLAAAGAQEGGWSAERGACIATVWPALSARFFLLVLVPASLLLTLPRP